MARTRDRRLPVVTPPPGIVLLLLLAAFLSAPPGAAQDGSDLSERPRAQAVRATGPLTLDGRLDEPAWSSAPPVESFTQNDPEEGRPVSEPTSVRFLYDGEALWVGAVLEDAEPVASRLGRRDQFMRDSDWFSVTLDTFHDHLTAVRFMVNPAGVRSDELLSGNSFRGDDSWDPVWEVETRVTETGWTVEMRIPFSQLRFSEAEAQVWGLQAERTIARRQEEAVFAFTPKSEAGGIPRFGHLTGLEGVQQGRGLELLPYAVGRAEYVDVGGPEDPPFESPYRSGSDYYGDVGLDVKYRLTSNLTLDGTVNPDFGQVELDPAVVNLTAFETRFDEKRPFFVEGSDIFSFGGGGRFGGTQLLYSRRIGARPGWRAPADALYADPPGEATILGAAKLTGRTAGGWVLGVLDAVTAEERGHFIRPDRTTGEEAAAPLTNHFAGRVQRNMREGRSVVGGMATAVHRRLDGSGLAAEMTSEAYSGGVDFSHEWGDRTWSVSGHVAGSHVSGEPEVIASLQRSSARYFDRPDAAHLTYDPLRGSLSGYTANLGVRKMSGLHWRGNADFSVTSPAFEVNDLGFQRSADRIDASGSVTYVETRPGELFRDWRVSLRPGADWNFGGTYLGSRLTVDARGQLLGYWSGNVRVSRDFPGFDDRLTRGGPLTREVATTRTSLSVESDSRKAWTVETELSYDRDEAGGGESELEVELELRPADAWSVSLAPVWSRARSVAQYVGSVEDPLAEETFGRRYLFADLEQTTVSVETRLNVTFRPGLTLELYAQPFIATGDFEGIKELRAPRTFSFLEYGRDVGTVVRDGDELVVDPDGDGPAGSFRVREGDFNRRSLRGNAVLRWEWLPGSTLFVVWQQERSDRADLDDFDLGRDTRALFSAPPDNVFMVKVSYWFSP